MPVCVSKFSWWNLNISLVYSTKKIINQSSICISKAILDFTFNQHSFKTFNYALNQNSFPNLHKCFKRFKIFKFYKVTVLSRTEQELPTLIKVGLSFMAGALRMFRLCYKNKRIYNNNYLCVTKDKTKYWHALTCNYR